MHRRHRPDAAYHANPDEQGRELVLVEIDLGHYSRNRILAKVQGFFEHPEARSILFATPTAERANLIARWAREAYGVEAMRRLQVFSFAELQRGARLDAGTQPHDHDRDDEDWYRVVMGDPGSR